ncbi:MAG: DNA repair exonuclease [Clostridiales bacterium]|nr:DNA repair exonuclease [Clostridiales bacterium]
MRLIHCADLHLDSGMRSNLSKEKARERKKELLLTFQRMVDYAAEHAVSAILIAGDLFDTRQISATARHAVWDAVCSHSEITFFYLKGNHDTEHFLAERETLPENFKVFGTEWISYPLGERIVISGLELSEENAGSAFHSLVLRPEAFNIVMLHGQETKTGARDKAQIIRLRELKHKGIDYLALGHVHAYKEGKVDARGVWCYPGCLEGRGFDECGEHGFVLLDVDEEAGTCKREFMPFAGRRLWEVPVDVSGCGQTTEMLERVREALCGQTMETFEPVKGMLCGQTEKDLQEGQMFGGKTFGHSMSERQGSPDESIPAYPDRILGESGETVSSENNSEALPGQCVITGRDLIKIILTGGLDVEAAQIDLEYLRKALEPDYYFVKISDETKLRVDTNRFLLDESLKGEFVRTVMAAEELSEEERAAVIRCGLRAIAGEEVLGCD